MPRKKKPFFRILKNYAKNCQFLEKEKLKCFLQWVYSCRHCRYICLQKKNLIPFLAHILTNVLFFFHFFFSIKNTHWTKQIDRLAARKKKITRNEKKGRNSIPHLIIHKSRFLRNIQRNNETEKKIQSSLYVCPTASKRNWEKKDQKG